MTKRQPPAKSAAHLHCIHCDGGAKDANGAYTVCALCLHLEELHLGDQEAA